MKHPDRALARRLIDRSRLYFVTDAQQGEVESLLRAALTGGADVVQLRDAELDDDGLIRAAASFRRLADEFGVPFVLNDRPDLVVACDADGVHVGQSDVPVARARELAGRDCLVGLSTHSPEQLAAAAAATGGERPDYVSVGPVWPTPTKPGRRPTGLKYVRHAAEATPFPWFAIGGIDESNVAEVAAAGADRVVVVRAIRDADHPERAAAALRARLDAAEGSRAATVSATITEAAR